MNKEETQKTLLTDVDDLVKAAHHAKIEWAKISLQDRVAIMEIFLEKLRGKRQVLINGIAKELNQPKKWIATVQVDYYLENMAQDIKLAENFLRERHEKNLIFRQEPYGVVACVTPWNYPLGQILFKIVPALLTGNCVIIKPSEYAYQTAQLVLQAAHESCFPVGVVQLLLGDGDVAKTLVCHSLVDMVSFTGSSQVGRQIAGLAGAQLKKVSLELGGKSAALVLRSANLEQAISWVLADCFSNSGQVCSACTRLLIPLDLKNKVEDLLCRKAKDFKAACFDREERYLGPIVNQRQYERVWQYVEQGLAEGASMLVGHENKPYDSNRLIQPIVFTDVRAEMTIAREEIFGPVLTVLTYRDLEEGIAIANGTRYGLSAAVFGDPESALRVARQIEAGQVLINGAVPPSDAPFGGFKQSGLAREGGIYGLLEFSQTKVMVR